MGHTKKRTSFFVLSMLSFAGITAISLASAGLSGCFFNKKSAIAPKNTTFKSQLEQSHQPYFLEQSSAWADSLMGTLSTEQKIAQFFMVAAWSSDEKNNQSEIDGYIKNYGIGGLIFFQGDTKKQLRLVQHYQSISKVPLLMGIDGEWGPAMRLKDTEEYPFQLTMGATHNPDLVEKAGYWIGRECQQVGMHIDFAPDADVNSNPKNPVINYRSFGESPIDVAAMTAAFVSGMEQTGELACAKHFPGHGDTDKDSHLELPTVSHSQAKLDSVDFIPFQHAIQQGVSSIMVAHLNVPALDTTHTPTSLSEKVIKGYLQQNLGFKGLIVSDALNMKGVADKYGKTEVVVKAFMAGNDILLFPESVSEAISALTAKVKGGEISMDEINRRCKKVLMAKHWAVERLKQAKPLNEQDSIQIKITKQQIAREAITVLKNGNNILPIKDMSPKCAVVLIGKEGEVFQARLADYMTATFFHAENGETAKTLLPQLAAYDRVVSVLLSRTVRPIKNYGFPDGWSTYLSGLSPKQENVVLLMGNPYVLANAPDYKNIDALVLGYENSTYTQDAVAQVLVGALPAKGKLPVNVNAAYTLGDGIATEGNLRLKFILPEEVGVNHHDFDAIDSIALDGIQKGAYPSCQVVATWKNCVLFRKAYGYFTYDKKQAVTNATVYDLASITKIGASTLSVMSLQDQGKFSLDSLLGSYLPKMLKGSPYSKILIRDMLAHQAGFTPWIPFYLHTLKNGQWKAGIFSPISKPGYTTQVAENMYILDTYRDSIYQEILEIPLAERGHYKYSDLGYYFLRQIIYQKTGLMENEYVAKQFYNPMGLPTMGYLPLKRMDKNVIAPTEDDKIFRKQQIWGYVHDQGAALLGGVGGHAGLFSNATDLMALMQMYLNGGVYGGKRYLSSEVLKEYTSCQFCPNNRRGAGFDKPVRSLDGGPTCNLVSLSSFGHSGFTGTLTWADPQYQIGYVFLSNSICPDAENKKLLHMSQRTKIQKVIYQAILKAENATKKP